MAAMLIAGCGGGGDGESTETTASTTSAPTALSKAELIEQGDAICGEVNAAVGSDDAGEGGAGAQIADLYSGMIASLNNLGAPKEKDGYAEFSEAAEELATAENAVKLASEREDTAALESAESTAFSALTTFQNAASEYGFKECSEGPHAPAVAAPGGSAEAGEAEPGGEEAESIEPEAAAPEVEPEPVPEAAPETGGAGGATEGGGSGAPEAGGGSTGGSSGGIGPG
ncbi:MAG TPA: hypothetical protein VJQ84_02880 [Solirubrobacterales bacterium]|nr:hypothetical protein [Solirubrobacterales bacterium]